MQVDHIGLRGAPNLVQPVGNSHKVASTGRVKCLYEAVIMDGSRRLHEYASIFSDRILEGASAPVSSKHDDLLCYLSEWSGSQQISEERLVEYKSKQF